jgi:hypothetical protein
MDEATRRSLLFSKELPEERERTSRRLSELAEGMSGGLEGLRQLQEAGFEAPEGLEWEEEEGEHEWLVKPTVDAPDGNSAKARKAIVHKAATVFAIAILTRLVFLYFVTNTDVLIPTWSNDTWHRWQIAYLSKEIGLEQHPARLWDLKGLEYFWGIVHPAIAGVLFEITGSVDVMILRWITMVAGALNIVFLYLIGQRFWGESIGLAAAAVATLNPIVIFNDPSGMVEPLSFLFLLAGIYLFPRRSLLAGLLWGLAALTRAEAWLMSAGLLFAVALAREKSSSKIALAVGWAVPVALYMKHLLDVTGNAIYPIYWNFLANALGEWVYRETLTDYQLAARPVLVAVFVISLCASAWVLFRRPRGYLFHLLGLGTTAFITGFIGLTAYLTGYEPWFWLTRFFVFSYLYLGFLGVLAVRSWIPGKAASNAKGPIAAAGTVLLVLGVQVLWPAVLYDVTHGYTNQPNAATLERQGRFIDEEHNGGRVLIPEDNPQLTYAAVRFGGLAANEILGQMYSPFYYYEGGDPLEHWDEVGPRMWEWFATENITVLVTNSGDARFQRMIQEKPERFTLKGTLPDSPMEIYVVWPQ